MMGSIVSMILICGALAALASQNERVLLRDVQVRLSRSDDVGSDKESYRRR
jgi:hypothetical protein